MCTMAKQLKASTEFVYSKILYSQNNHHLLLKLHMNISLVVQFVYKYCNLSTILARLVVFIIPCDKNSTLEDQFQWEI